jgi:hypothetical protein
MSRCACFSDLAQSTTVGTTSPGDVLRCLTKQAVIGSSTASIKLSETWCIVAGGSRTSPRTLGTFKSACDPCECESTTSLTDRDGIYGMRSADTHASTLPASVVMKYLPFPSSCCSFCRVHQLADLLCLQLEVLLMLCLSNLQTIYYDGDVRLLYGFTDASYKAISNHINAYSSIACIA